MRKAPVLILTIVFAATCFVACQKQDFETDEDAIRALVKGDPAHFTSGTAGDSSENSLAADDTTMGTWWRGPQTHDSAATIDVEVHGDSAWVGFSAGTGGAAENHDVGGFGRGNDLNIGEVVAQVAARQHEAGRSWMVFAEIGGSGHGRRQDLVGPDVETH